MIELFYKTNTKPSILNNCFRSLLHFAELQKDNTQLFQNIIIILLFRQNYLNELQSIFVNHIFDQDSKNNNAIKGFAQICHLSSNELISKYSKLQKQNKIIKLMIHQKHKIY